MARLQDMQQVLELSLSYMSDIKTLAACSQLSQRCRLCTQQAVALNLPSLVQQCAAGVGLDGQLQQLRWLCHTAGPAAVNSHAAGCAILKFVGTLDWWEQPMTYWRPGVELAVLAATTVQATGLVFTNALLAHALVVNWTAGHPHTVLSSCDLSQTTPYFQTVALSAAANDDMHDLADVGTTVSAVTAADLPGLLRIACRHNPNMARLLLDHDRDHVHLLHSDAASAEDGTTAPAASMHQQQQQREAGAQQLLWELLEGSVKHQCSRVLQRLCDVPAAQRLSCIQVSRLLLLAASNPYGCWVESSRARPCVMAVLASLPAAQKVSADCIAAAVRCGIEARTWEHLAPLLELPNAKRVNSWALCDLLLEAAHANLMRLFSRLSRLADDRTLDSKPVTALVRAVLDDPRLLDHDNVDASFFGAVEHILSELDPGRHLGGEGVLESFEHCVEKGEETVGDIVDLCSFTPAASQITDIPRFVAVLSSIGSWGWMGYACDRVEYLLSTGVRPVMLQLQASDWCTIMQSGGGISDEVLQLPAVQQITTDQVVKLLRVAVKQYSCHVPQLATIPAAQQVPPELVGEFLSQLLHRAWHDPKWIVPLQAWDALLSLPPAQHIATDVLQQLITTAAEAGFGIAMCKLQRSLSSAAELQCGLSGKELSRSILQTVRRKRGEGWGDALVLAGQPGMQQLSASGIASLTLAVLELPRKYWGGFWIEFDADSVNLGVSELDPEDGDAGIDLEARMPGRVCLLSLLVQLPAFAQQSAEGLVELIEAFVVGRAAASLQREDPFPPRLTALPAAADISADQLLQVLEGVCQRLQGDSVRPLLQLLVKLPAWQQLNPGQFVTALGLCLKHHLGKCTCDSALCGEVSELLSQHPVRGALSGLQIVELVQTVVHYSTSSQLVAVLLQHPAGQQVGSEGFFKLFQMFSDRYCWADGVPDCVKLLLHHPAAEAVEVPALFSILQEALAMEGSPAMPLLLKLPAAQQLSAEHLQVLSQQALQSS